MSTQPAPTHVTLLTEVATGPDSVRHECITVAIADLTTSAACEAVCAGCAHDSSACTTCPVADAFDAADAHLPAIDRKRWGTDSYWARAARRAEAAHGPCPF